MPMSAWPRRALDLLCAEAAVPEPRIVLAAGRGWCIHELKDIFGLTDEGLNVHLGPPGDLL
jgi:hypothetical protein